MAIPGIGTALGLGTLSIAGATIGVGAVIGLGLEIAGSLLLGPATPKPMATTPTTALFATLDTVAPRKIAFGHTALGNDVRYQAYTGTNQAYIDQIVCHASHAVQAIEELWLDNELAWSSAGGVQGRYVGYLTVDTRTEGNSSNGIAIDSTWTSSCTLTGCAYSHVQFKLTGNSSSAQSPFASGVTSRTTWRGKGAKVYDPRLDSTVTGGSGSQRANDQTTWAWDDNASRNPALQELFYELGWKIGGKVAVGLGLPPVALDLASYAVGANHCDESIALNGGGTEPRYRSDGLVSESDDPGAVRDNLCWTMNAMLRDSGDQLSLTVIVNDLGTPVTPAGKTSFDHSDIQGQVQWEQTPDLSSTFNVVRGKRVDPSNTSLYQPVDYPDATLTSNDGIDRIDTFNLQFVQSNGQAQRLAKQRLQRSQYQGKLTFVGQPSFWGVSIGDVFPLSMQAFGWSSKLFRVASQKISRTGAVEITALEENAAIYAWANNESAPVTPGAPTVYDPLNSPILTGILASGNSAAPGDSNRVRLSRFERELLGWVYYNPNSLTIATWATNHAAVDTVNLVGSFTANSQQVAILNDAVLSGNRAFRIPVTPGERIFVGCEVGFASHTGYTWQLTANFKADDNSAISATTLSTGTGDNALAGDFVIVPAGAVYLSFELYGFSNSGGAGSFSMALAQPMVCGAGSAQTVRPAFTPGPSGEYGADVTALIDLPASVIVYADSTGTPKSGEIPKSIGASYLRSGTALLSGVSWSASRSEGNAAFTIGGSGVGDLEITGPNNSTLAAESQIDVTATYQGITRSASIKVIRQDDPPTSTGGTGGGGGGGSGSTTTLGNTTGTSYDLTNSVSATLTVPAGSSGQVACTAPIGFKRTGVTNTAGPDGETGAAGKWQWRVIGGTWADIDTEVTSGSNTSLTYYDSELNKYFTPSGSLSVSHTKSGLTSGTSYEFRFCWRRIDVNPTAENIRLNSGTLQAVGS